MSDLNKKHALIKFEVKYSQTKIEFLDVLIYKCQYNATNYNIYEANRPINLL